jgi:serine/threonine protein phosphatase PrpC
MEDAACVQQFTDVPALKHWVMFGVFDGHGGQ